MVGNGYPGMGGDGLLLSNDSSLMVDPGPVNTDASGRDWLDLRNATEDSFKPLKRPKRAVRRF